MYNYRICSAGNKNPIHEPVTSHACLPYQLPVAMHKALFQMLWAGIAPRIKHGELWLQVHKSHYYMQDIDHASVH